MVIKIDENPFPAGFSIGAWQLSIYDQFDFEMPSGFNILDCPSIKSRLYG